MKQKLIVITNADGNVVGTQVQDFAPSPGVVARLVAGPGQKLHTIELEVPARFATRKAIDQFHTHLEGLMRK